MNTPVKFETAKLIKEKKYGNKTPHKLRRDYYNHLGELNADVTDYVKALVNKEELTHLEPIDAPTIADVVMWLYKEYRIWIWVERYSTLFRPYSEEKGDKRFGKWEGHKYSTPTEAYEAAIEYTLKNLI